MSRCLFIKICVGIFVSFYVTAESQSEEVPRCFQFTWLGGPDSWHNETDFETATCSDVTQLTRGVPCVRPLVLSHNGSWPDVKHIWKEHPKASCILSDTDVCAKFTYSFRNTVENSTLFCTRAVDKDGHSIRSGCHEQINGSSSIKVCFCRSVAGEMPCNNSIVPSVNYLTIALLAIAIALNFFVNTK